MRRLFVFAVVTLFAAFASSVPNAHAVVNRSRLVPLPRWLAPAETKALNGMFGGAKPSRVYHLQYPEKIAVVFEFSRIVICGTCSAPSNASIPRGKVIRLSFDRHTHAVLEADGLRFCESRGSYPPKSECLRR